MKLDEWTDEQVDFLTDSGGNGAVNSTYEAFLGNYTKPRQDCSADDRNDFIRYTELASSYSLRHVPLV